MKRTILSVLVPVGIGLGVTIGVGALLGLSPLVALGGGIIAGGGLLALAATAAGAIASGLAGSLLRSWLDGSAPTARGVAASTFTSVVLTVLGLGLARGVGDLLAPVLESLGSRTASVVARAPAPVRQLIEAVPSVKPTLPQGAKFVVVAPGDGYYGDFVGVEGSAVIERNGLKWPVTGTRLPSGDFFVDFGSPYVHMVLRTAAQHERAVAGVVGAAAEIGAGRVASEVPMSRTHGIDGALGQIDKK